MIGMMSRSMILQKGVIKMFLRYLNEEKLYNIKATDGYNVDGESVRFDNPTFPIKAGGFDIVYDDKNVNSFYRQYNVVYEATKEYVVFTNDNTEYKTFFVYDENGFVSVQVTTPGNDIENGVLRFSGKGKEFKYPELEELFDEDGFNLYKVVDGEVVTTTDEEKADWEAEQEKQRREQEEKDLEDAKSAKIQEISSACSNAILAGVEINGSHYGYDMTDQNNILNMTTLALQTGLAVPYHADGEDCRLFTRDEIVEIYVAEETNVTHNVTYNNQMKDYIKSLDDIDAVKAIEYGTPLSGKWLDTYNEMMAQAQEIIKAFTERN